MTRIQPDPAPDAAPLPDAPDATEAPPLPDSLFLVTATDEATGESHDTLSFSRAPTVLLTFAANRFTRVAARDWQARFGLGAMEWRMMVMLTREPGATAARAAELTGVDKGAVSRALHGLRQKGLARQGALQANGRSRGWRLTEAGHGMHAQMLARALARQRRLLAGFAPQEVEALCGMLARFLDNLESLKAEDRAEGAGKDELEA